MERKYLVTIGMIVLLLIGVALGLKPGAEVGPLTFLKLKHELGHPNIVDQASFAAVRAIQDEVLASVGGSPAWSIKHPVTGMRCYDCHAGEPKGAQHENVSLNETDPAASCGLCHTNDLYQRLASLPYFTELKFELSDPASVADAEVRVDNAVALDTRLDYSSVVAQASEVKWEFEVKREPQEPGGFPGFFDSLLDKTAEALQLVKDHHITTEAVSSELEVKVEAKAFALDQAERYISEFNTLDTSISSAVSGASIERKVEVKWKPALPYDTAYDFIRETISSRFGAPKEEKPDKIEWDLGAGAKIVAEFKHPEDGFTHETKVKFEKITTDVEDDAFATLTEIAAQYPAATLDEAKLEHKYLLKKATMAENTLLINTLGAYTASSPLPDKEFKYEVKVKKGTDVFEVMLDFFDQKRDDHPSSLVKTKTELKWHPLDAANYEYKVEVVAAQRD